MTRFIWLWVLLLDCCCVLAQNCPEYMRTQYDYIIVGAGTAGSVLAARLSENPSVNVLLLEAGEKATDRRETPFINTPGLAKQLRNSSIDWKFITTPQKHALFGYRNKQAALPRGKAVGGTSAINDMIYQRGSHEIYNEWERLGAKGWEFKRVAPYFIKSVDTKVMELSKSGVCRIQTNIRSGERLTTAKAYLDEARGRPNLNIVTKTFVTRVLIANRKAVGVEFIFSNSTFQVLSSKEVILSAGSYGTPKILLLSGIGPRKHLQQLKIPMIADLAVGENLQDHVSVDIRVSVNASTIKPNKRLERLMMEQYFYRRKGLMASIGGSEAFLFVNTNKSRSLYPDLQFIFRSTLPDHDHQLLRVMNKNEQLIRSWYTQKKGQDGITITVKLLHPKSRGSVTLESKDPAGEVVINPNYLSDPDDITKLIEGINIVQSLVNIPVMQSIGATLDPPFDGCNNYGNDTDEYWKCFIQTFSDPGHHPVSTCKMGAFNDVRTVVDHKLRVKDVFSLRVVDASVLPEITDHPSAAVIMIAERAADMILK